MVYCHQCGHANPDGSNFCARCGTKLQVLGNRPPVEEPEETAMDTTTVIPVISDDTQRELTDEEQSAIEDLEPGSALLIVVRGPAAERFRIDADETVVGRSATADIFLDDITVSRNQLLIVREGSSFKVRDVGSMNGTYVNRDLIDSTVDLKSGDVLQVGKFRMVFAPAPRAQA